MAEKLLWLVEQWGVWGVYLSLFVEGSAFPFIGTFFIVTVGFLLELSWFEIVLISVIGSLFYAVGSYIPYFIGLILGSKIENRLKEANKLKFDQMKEAFSKYGVWSVAISSPLHLGNIVPFFAGMSKMNLLMYTLLTMLGIAPTTFIFLAIGYFHQGNPKDVMKTINYYQEFALFAFVLITVVYVYVKVRKNRKLNRKSPSSK